MYAKYFNLSDLPFTLAPDPRFVFLSERHREALAHLLYGLGETGGFVQLTGEVGTGKTTICRTLLRQIPQEIDVALIFNPVLNVSSLLQTMCQELRIKVPKDSGSVKALMDALYGHLLAENAAGRRPVLIIDEAQNLSPEVLEQIRLLTNLETDEKKLLQVFLIGQPELRSILGSPNLRQLAQRITARYHLEPLRADETADYVRHRLKVAGRDEPLFTPRATRLIHRLTGGIPRLINVLCDRSMLGAYTRAENRINPEIVRRAHAEVHGLERRAPRFAMGWLGIGVAVAAVLVSLLAVGGGQVTGAWVREVRAVVQHGLSSESVTPVAVQPVRPDAAAGRAESLAPARAPDGSRVAAPDGSAAAAPRAATPRQVVAVDAPKESMLARPDPREAAATLSPPTEPVGPRVRPDARLEPNFQTLLSATDASDFTPVAARLLALWSVPKPPADAKLCDWVRQHGLACHVQRGTWDTLRRLGLPALLNVRSTPRADSRQVLLLGLSAREGAVLVGATDRVFELTELRRAWDGNFVVLWRLPPHGTRFIQRGDDGEAVDWMQRRLAQIDGIYASRDRDAGKYNTRMIARIKNFQQLRGIGVDGIAGPETLIHLMAATTPRVSPRLSTVVRDGSPVAEKLAQSDEEG